MLTIATYESKQIQGSLGMSQVGRSQRMRSLRSKYESFMLWK